MRPGEVLDAQGDLLDRLTGDPLFRKYVDAMGVMEFGRSGGFREDATTPVGQMMANAVKVAHTYRVSHDMSMVVEHAANQLDDTDRFDPSLAPDGVGFVAFDRPLPVHDMRGKTMLIHFLIWGPASTNHGPATLMFGFNDTWRQPDMVATDMPKDYPPEVWARQQEIMGRWATVGVSAFFKDQRLGPAMSLPSEAMQARLLAEGDQPHEGTNVIRYLHALWLLLGQTVAKVEDEHVERPSRRRAERRKLSPKVTVIKLRREKGATRAEGESLIEWAHRWVVKGHWRWQAVGERHPLAQEIEPGKFRARIWINPFVKGPEGAPFKQSEKIYSLER